MRGAGSRIKEDLGGHDDGELRPERLGKGKRYIYRTGETLLFENTRS